MSGNGSPTEAVGIETSGSKDFALRSNGYPDLQSTLFFESVEETYRRVFRELKPRTAVPDVSVHFRRYASANSRIRLESGKLTVCICDVLQDAPAPIHEALALILLHKLFRKALSASVTARYRRFLNRADIRKRLEQLKQQRGRKAVLAPAGSHFDLCQIFEKLNLRYFFGLMAQPRLGWSLRPSRTTLGHYDPSHHTIVLSSVLDSIHAPALIVEYVMFHEMLHLKFPAQHRAARRCIHTREFKDAEASFEEFEMAKRQLARFIERLPRSS